MPPWRSFQARGLAWVGLVLATLSVSVFTLTAAFGRIRSRLPSSYFTLSSSHPTSRPASWSTSSLEPVEGAWLRSGDDWVSAGKGILGAAVPADDYRLSVLLQPVAGEQTLSGAEVLLRMADPLTCYTIAFQADGLIVLSRTSHRDEERLAWVKWSETSGSPVEVQAEARGATVRLWVNHSLVIVYEDPDPILNGGVGVGSTGPAIRVSGVRVEGVGGEELGD